MWQDVPLCQLQGTIVLLYCPPHNSTLYCVAFDTAFHDKVMSVLSIREAPLDGELSEGAAGGFPEGGRVG